MWQDPIVAETRALRDEYARQFNYDINDIFKDLMVKQAAHPERVVAFPPRKLTVSAVVTQKSASADAPTSRD
ncbi:hypothetical protein [Allochromatium palmeri]|uniref:Uncharacterized protein n=1 Tax=Allochromatium palmeri TaxID=231048 RepID=A0A6N8E9V8_9GAMM|nr:hypothetical protein [Allochromatium palmeri]MTW19619.1 hypothetical protein [Allochromatium palmeri]